MNARLRSRSLILSACIVALAVGGCSGSGGDGPRPIPAAPPPPPPPSPPPPPPPSPPPGSINYNDAEYQRSNGATAHNAIAAYNAGGTGQGVKIAVIDSGINPNLAEFAGKIDPASRDVVANRGIVDTEGHGTAVSAVAAAARNGMGMMGVAFNSTILSYNSSDPNNCDKDDGCSHSDTDIARGIDLARQNGAKVINISLGGEGAGSAMLNAVARATQAGIVVVMSAGNEELANPSGFALQSAQMSGNGSLIIAGAHDANRQIASFSNRAGSGAVHYLTALGVQVRSIDQNGVATLWSGTSFSAPVISGAAALLASAFPNLSGSQIVEILLRTADDAGQAGRDTTYGNGILNIGRAFQPIGQASLAGSMMAVDLGEGSETSAPTGDGGGRGESIGGAIILDGYSRAFAVDFASSLKRAAQEQPLHQALGGHYVTSSAGAGGTAVTLTVSRRMNGAPTVGMAQMGLGYEDARQAKAVAGMAVSRLSPRTAVAFGLAESGRTLQQRLSGQYGNAFLVARDPLARNGFHADAGTSFGVRQDVGPVSLTVSAERGEVYRPGVRTNLLKDEYSIASVTADRKIGPATVSLGASRLQEDRTILGGRYASALTSGGSSTIFVDGTASFDLGDGWGAFASYRRGWTSAPGTGALVERGRLATDAFAFDLSKAGALTSSDKLALRISQPLRVRSGGFDLNMPVSYDYATGDVGFEQRFLNLAPTGREVDYELAYSVGALGGNLGLNAYLRTDPGHIETMKKDVGGAIRFTLGF